MTEEEEEEDTIDKWGKKNSCKSHTHNAYTHTRNTNVLSKFILRIAFLTSVWKYINKKKSQSRRGTRMFARIHIIHILYIIVISVRRRWLAASASSCRCISACSHVSLLKFDLFFETSSIGTNTSQRRSDAIFDRYVRSKNRVVLSL